MVQKKQLAKANCGIKVEMAKLLLYPIPVIGSSPAYCRRENRLRKAKAHVAKVMISRL